MYLSFKWTGRPIMGLFIDGGITDWASLLEFLKRLIIPITVISLNEACGLIRRIRFKCLTNKKSPMCFALEPKVPAKEPLPSSIK